MKLTIISTTNSGTQLTLMAKLDNKDLIVEGVMKTLLDYVAKVQFGQFGWEFG